MGMYEKDSDTGDFANGIVISYDYPHNLLRHMRKLQGEGKLSSVLRDDFYKRFCEQYAEYPDEIRELQVAYETDLLADFYEKNKAAIWLKRAFISKTVFVLMRSLTERQAVELVESLMHLFGWHFSMEIERKWDVSEEDKANFHQADDVKMVEGGELERRAKELAERQEDEEQPYGEEEASFDAVGASAQTDDEKRRRPDGAERAAGHSRRETDRRGSERRRHSAARDSGDAERTAVQKPEQKKSALQELILETEETKPKEKREVKYLKLMKASLRREIKPAERGNSASQRQLGDFYAEEGSNHLDYREAARWYRYSANQGDYRSLLELGKILDGRKLAGETGEEEMKAEGFRYFKRLAEKGYPTAQCIVGLKYYFGDYVQEDLAEAAKWLRMAAVQNNIDAQRALGNLYNRLGNTKEAKSWYQKAAALGDSYSKEQFRRL